MFKSSCAGPRVQFSHNNPGRGCRLSSLWLVALLGTLIGAAGEPAASARQTIPLRTDSVAPSHAPDTSRSEWSTKAMHWFRIPEDLDSLINGLMDELLTAIWFAVRLVIAFSTVRFVWRLAFGRREGSSRGQAGAHKPILRPYFRELFIYLATTVGAMVALWIFLKIACILFPSWRATRQPDARMEAR